jgi:hypothetical protein
MTAGRIAIQSVLTGLIVGIAVYHWLENAPTIARAFWAGIVAATLLVDAYTLTKRSQS